MIVNTLLNMFPPPEYMAMPYVGLDMADDAIRAISYRSVFGQKKIRAFSKDLVRPGLLSEGDTKNDEEYISLLKKFITKNNIKYARVSIAEEKVYLFQIQVPNTDKISLHQNIESKLEDNVPLSAKDALFYYELIPTADESILKASVTVTPRSYIERRLKILNSAGVIPLAFESVPRSVTRMINSSSGIDTVMVVHTMSKKWGIYIIEKGILAFATTIDLDMLKSSYKLSEAELYAEEISRIYDYWVSKQDNSKPTALLLCGVGAQEFEKSVNFSLGSLGMNISVPNIWENIFHKSYIPPISKNDSLEYVVSAGLALSL